MMLLKRYLRSELSTLLENDIRFNVIGTGRRTGARRPAGAARRRATTAEEHRHACSTSRSTTAGAPRSSTRRGARSRRAFAPDELDEARFGELLYTAGQPDPDLLIRTSGEMRVSNFLLWQIAYAEIYVTDTLWPDFRCRDLLEAILAYQKRDRRYGGIAVAGGGRREVAGARSMARLLSGVVLAAVFFGAIWFLTPVVLLVVALVVAALAFAEYARIVGAIGARRAVVDHACC